MAFVMTPGYREECTVVHTHPRWQGWFGFSHFFIFQANLPGKSLPFRRVLKSPAPICNGLELILLIVGIAPILYEAWMLGTAKIGGDSAFQLCYYLALSKKINMDLNIL